MKYLCTVKKFALPPATVKGAPGPFAAFLRLFPLFVSLHSRFHLFRAKDCRFVKHLVQSGKGKKQRVFLSERASQGDA